MVKNRQSQRSVGGIRSRAVAIASLVGAVTIAGCDTLLEVELPGQVPAETLDNPTTAALQRLGAQADFECMVANYAGVAGLFTDELVFSTSFLAYNVQNNRAVTPSDNNTLRCVNGNGFNYQGITYTALAQGRDVTRRLEQWTDAEVPNRNELLSYTANYAAYAMTYLGEGWCEAVLENGGAVLQPREVLLAAEEWFTKALNAAEAAGVEETRNLALVGRARVRLNLGGEYLDGAVADAEKVPAGFEFSATYSGASPDRENKLYVAMQRGNLVSVWEPFRNLTVDGVPDVRPGVINGNRKGVDGITDMWYTTKYAEVDSPVRVASWDEAQLIIAEARLGQEAVDRINAVRDAYGLPRYEPANPSDDDAILDQVLEERRRTLFLEGHRLNDLRRHDGRLQWEEGVNHTGSATFGQQYCFPLPQREQDANPNA